MAQLQGLNVALTSSFVGNVDINGGTIDGVTITGGTLNNITAISSSQFTGSLTGDVIGEIGNSGTNRNPAWFTTVNTSQGLTVGTTLDVTGGLATLDNVDINGGTLDDTIIGQAVRAAGNFTTVNANSTITATDGFITTASSSLGAVVLGGNLTIGSGNSILYGIDVLVDASKNATFNDLNLTGDAQINGDFAVLGAFAPSAINVGAGASSFGGDVEISGDLTVLGTETTINSTTIELTDRQITLNSGATGTPAQTSYGLEIFLPGFPAKTFSWNEAIGKWTVLSDTFVAGQFEGDLVGNVKNSDETIILTSGSNSVAASFTGNVTGNADTASAWATARSVTFATGDVTGTFSIDGSANVTNVDLTIEDNSVALGTQTTGNYVRDITVQGNGISVGAGSPGEGTQYRIDIDAVSTNTPSTLVFRDGTGNFVANNITATSLIGNINSTAGSDTLNNTTVGGTLTVTGNTTFNNAVTVSGGNTFSSDTVAITGGNITSTDIGIGAGNRADIEANNITAIIGFAGDLTGDVTGNADSATALDHSVTFSISGDATGSATPATLTGNTLDIPITIANNAVELSTNTTGKYAREITVTSGRGLTITVPNADDGTDYEITANSTSASTPSFLVLRDGSGNFAANEITASLFDGDLTGDVTGNLAGNVSSPGTSGFNIVNITGLATLSDVDINGGTIDGTIIGNSGAAAGTFTTINGTTITASAATGFVGNIEAPSGGIVGTSTLNNLNVNGTLTLAAGEEFLIGTTTVIDNARNALFNDLELTGDFTIQAGGAFQPDAIVTGAGNSSIGGPLVVEGAFTAEAAANFFASQIELNANLTAGDNPVAGNSGLAIKRGNQGSVNFVWNETQGNFTTDGEKLEASDFVGSIGATTRSTGQFTTIDTSSNAAVGGVLTVTGTSTLTGAVSAPGGITGSLIGQVTHSAGTSTFDNLTITGDVSIDGILSADNFELPGVTNAGTLNLSGTLDVDGNMSGLADLTIQGTADIGTDLIVRGQPRIQGTTIRLHTEILSGSTPSVDDDVGIVVNRGDDADIKFLWNEGVDRWIADIALQSDNIYGEFTGSVNVGAGETLNVSAGTLTLADNQISGDKINGGTIDSITLTTVNSGNAIITGGSIDSTVIGGTTPANITGLTITADTGFDGNLTGDVIGDLSGNVNAGGTGTSAFNNINVGNTLSVSGATTFNDDVTYVLGTTTTFDGDLDINGNINLTNFVVGGTLDVAGRASFADKYIDIHTGLADTEGGIRIEKSSGVFATLQYEIGTSQWSVGTESFEAGTFKGNLEGNVTSTGTSTLATVDIDGGNIDNTEIGGSTPNRITGTTITANNGFSGDLIGSVTSSSVSISGGNIDGTVIGNSVPANISADQFTANRINMVSATDEINIHTLNVTDNLDVTANAQIDGTLDVDGESTLASATVSDLTNGRVVLAGASGSLEDSANLTFSGSILSVSTGFSAYTSGRVDIGQNLTVTGISTFNDDVTVNSDTEVTGDLTVGGAIIVDNLALTGNLSVSGDLTVTGTTTTVNTQTINLADNIITLNSDYTGNSPSENAGIEINRGGGTEPNAELVWNETLDQWEAKEGVFVSAAGFDGSLTGNVTGNVTSTGTSTFSTVDINGGAIDGTTIGDSTPDSGSFTDLEANDITVSNNVTAQSFSGPLTGNVTGTVSSLSNHTTDALAEGTQSNRKYYSDALVDLHLSGGLGVNYTAGAISIGQAVGTTDNVTFADVTVNGILDADNFAPTSVNASGAITAGTDLTVERNTVLKGTVDLHTSVLVLNSDFTGGSPTANVGISVTRDLAGNKTLLWDENEESWSIGTEKFIAGTFEGDVTGDVTSTGTSTFSTVDINGGAIDGVVIGANDAQDITGNQIEGTVITATTNFVGDITGDVTGGLTLGVGDTLDVSAGTPIFADNQISGNKIDGGAISNASLSGNNATNIITGYDIVVGSGRTLNVGSGTLTLSNNQISGDKIDGGVISNSSLTGDNSTNSITGYNINVGSTRTLVVDGAATFDAVTANGLASLDGGIDVDGVFTVADTTGDVVTSGTLAAANTTVNGTLTATGLASLDGGIDVDGAFTVADTTGNVVTSGTMQGSTITATSGFTGNITSTGTSVFSGTVNLNGATVSNAAFDLAGDLTGDVTSSGTSSFSILNVTNLASLDGGIDVDGAFTVANTSGNVSTSGTLTAGTTQINGTLTATGLASLDGGIDVDGVFTVADTTGDVATTGSITGGVITSTSGFVGNITSTGNSAFSGAIDLDGATVSNAAFNLAGNITSTGTSSFSIINVSGLASLDGGIDVDGAFTVADTTGDVATTGTLAAGATTVTGTLNATGLATFNGGIDMDGVFTVANTSGNVATSGTLAAGNTSISGTLITSGQASLNGGISVDGAFTVADATGNVNTVGTITAGDITGDIVTASTNFVGDITGNVTSTGTSSFSDVNITGGSISGVTLSLGAGSSVSAASFIGPLVGDVTSSGTSTFSGNVNFNGANVTNAAFNLIGNVTGNVTGSGTSTFAEAVISGGTINGVVIGGGTPGQITGTTITANNGFSGNITGDVIGDVIGDVVGNVTGTVSSLANLDTDDLAQGTVNRYYADTLVDAHLSGGLGVTYTNGVIAIGQDVSTNADVTFNDVTVNGTLTYVDDLTFDNLTISGNLTVNGATTTINSETIELADNIITLNSNEAGAPTQSAGIEVQRGTSTNVSLTWNESVDKWTIGSETFIAGTFEGDLDGNLIGNVTANTGTSSFTNITASGTITSNGGFDGNLTGSVTGNVTGTVSSLSNHTTDDLVEGANLYYTTARLESRLGGNLTTSLIPAQDAIYNIGSGQEQWANGFFSGTVDAGTLTALTKSFVIPHPTKPGMKLRYGSLEGPENGVYVRGRLQAGNVIELPDYWTGLVDEDSITVTLTANRGYQQLYVEDIVNNTVIVGCENKEVSEIDCFYTVWGERKDVAPFTVEYKDQDEE